jgi:hypothetical protein
MNRAAVSVQESDIASKLVNNNIAHNRSLSSFITSTWLPLVAESQSISITTKPLVQPRLKIGAADDKYEQEADQLADEVMRMSKSRLLSSAAEPRLSNNSHSGSGLSRRVHPSCAAQNQTTQQAQAQASYRVQAKPVVEPCLLQRQEMDEEEDEELQIQAKALGQSPVLTPNIASGIRSLHGSGRLLPQTEREFFEPRIGVDFSRVNIHTDHRAADLAGKINARAFTVGNCIVFGAGQYQPRSYQGRRLMAHELIHVVQQSNAQNANLSLVQRDAPASPSAAASGGLSDEMIRQIARRLRLAMRGWGTDEEAIYSSFSGRTQEQVDEIARVYQQMYQRSLIDDLRDELTESEMMRLAIFSPTMAVREGEDTARNLADMVAHQLNRAMDRIGTDEESVYAALSGRTVTERRAIKAAYRRLTSRELEADIRSEFSGTELTEALRLLNQGMLEPEDELYFAMQGAGTDEATLFRVLRQFGGNKNTIINMMSAYRTKYGDFLSDLRGDLSAAEYARASRLLWFLSGYVPEVRYSSRRVYGYSRQDTTKLYGVQSAANLVPASAFDQTASVYTDYTRKWQNRLNLSLILGSFANDCGQYAEHLISLTGRTPPARPGTRISRPGIALRPTNDLQPGEAYFIRPVSGGVGEAVAEDILSPWNNTVTVRKNLTNFHMATVVARDHRTVVTSEVNAAFPGRVTPWFTMYRGNRGFYRTYRREYRASGQDPELWRL